MRVDNNRAAIFLDSLNLVSGLRLLLFAVSNPVASVRYLTISRSGRVIVALLVRLGLCSEVKKLELDFSSPMPQGGGLWYWAEAAVEDVSRVIAARIGESGSFLEYVSARIEPARRITFVRKLLSQELYRTMVLVLLAQRGTETGGRALRKVVFVSVSDLLPLFVDASGRWVEDITFVNFANSRNLLPLRLLWFLSEQCRVLGRVVVERLRRRGQEGGKKKNTVALQYVWGLDGKALSNDLWWYKVSGLENSRCLIFFDRAKNPATDQIIQRLNELGIRYCILNEGSNKTSKLPVDRFSIQRGRWVIPDLVSLIGILSWARYAQAPLWQMGRWFSVLVSVRRRQAFMEAESVKVIFDVAETSLDTASLAADIVGAVKVGTHWSDISYPRARVTPLQQVYFVWGPRYQAVLEEMEAASVLVQVGSIFDYGEAKSEWRERAKVYRTRLEKAGVKHVVGILDRSCSPTSLCPPAYHTEFYEALLSWAENDLRLGLIVKPKYDTPGVFSYKPELSNRLRALISSGRALLFEGQKHAAEAALASDIMIALGLNSAGILCGLEGVRTVFWDPSQADKGPLSQWVHRFGWSNENITFHSMSQLVATVKDYLNCPSAAPGLGDLSPVLDEIDNFRDGNAALRIGAFVRWFLEGLDEQCDRIGALQFAIDKYVAKWGVDKVHWQSQDRPAFWQSKQQPLY